MAKSVSVIVPVRNEAQSIERTLISILNQDVESRFEVIVADGGSDDETVCIVRRLQAQFKNLKLVYNPGRLASSGRNAAIRHMSGDYAVIVDGHCHIQDRRYIANLLSAFEQSAASCLGRPQPLDVPNPTSFQHAVSIARSSRLGHNPDSDIFANEPKFVEPQSTAVAYQRQVFHRVGMFDERFDACEDVEFNQRVHMAGETCYFTPDLKVIYEPRRNLRSLFKQLGRYGAGRARLAFKHPNSLTLPALVPPAWLIALSLGTLLSVLSVEVGLVTFSLMAVYISILSLAAWYLARSKSIRIQSHVFTAFVCIHTGFAWGFLKETVKCARRKLI